jgi:hypothetical protein
MMRRVCGLGWRVEVMFAHGCAGYKRQLKWVCCWKILKDGAK